MRLFCHIVTYSAFILSVISMILLCVTLKPRFLKKTAPYKDRLETMRLKMANADGSDRLKNEEAKKYKKEISQIFANFYMYEVLFVALLAVVGCAVCFFDGISMKDEWLTAPALAFFIGMVVPPVLLSPQIFYYAGKYKLSFKPDRDEIPNAVVRTAARRYSGRSAFTMAALTGLVFGALTAATAFIFMVDFIV